MNAQQETLVAAYIPLARSLAAKASRFSNDPDMFVGDALEALCIAATSFDTARGSAFGAYAKKVISNRLFHTGKRDQRYRETTVSFSHLQDIAARKAAFTGGSAQGEQDLNPMDWLAPYDDPGFRRVERGKKFVARWFGALEPVQQTLVKLSYHGATQAEMAKAVQRSQPTVSKMLRGLRTDLSAQLVA